MEDCAPLSDVGITLSVVGEIQNTNATTRAAEKLISILFVSKEGQTRV